MHFAMNFKASREMLIHGRQLIDPVSKTKKLNQNLIFDPVLSDNSV